MSRVQVPLLTPSDQAPDLGKQVRGLVFPRSCPPDLPNLGGTLGGSCPRTLRRPATGQRRFWDRLSTSFGRIANRRLRSLRTSPPSGRSPMTALTRSNPYVDREQGPAAPRLLARPDRRRPSQAVRAVP